MKRKAIFVFMVIVCSLLPAGAGPVPAGLTSDQTILHLLNRISFGPRPGDVERVKQLGIPKYIDEQLHPEQIDDSAVTSQLATFPSIKMAAGEINKHYVPANEIARKLGLTKGN